MLSISILPDLAIILPPTDVFPAELVILISPFSVFEISAVEVRFPLVFVIIMSPTRADIASDRVNPSVAALLILIATESPKIFLPLPQEITLPLIFNALEPSVLSILITPLALGLSQLCSISVVIIIVPAPLEMAISPFSSEINPPMVASPAPCLFVIIKSPALT